MSRGFPHAISSVKHTTFITTVHPKRKTSLVYTKMSDSEDPQSIEELLKRKLELEQLNNSLATRLQEGEKIKGELKDARKDSQKLLHRREKLKHHASKYLDGNEVSPELKPSQVELQNTQEYYNIVVIEDNKDEELPSPQKVKEKVIGEGNPIQLRRELNALQVENASLIKEKRKTEEHKAKLVQELADLNIQHENLQALCNKLKEEIGRLSTYLAERPSSGNKTNAEKDDIELLKAQLRGYQEKVNAMENQFETSQRANQRLRAELREAREVIRDLRHLPKYDVYRPYSAPVYAAEVYGARLDDGLMEYEPSRYHLVRAPREDYRALEPRPSSLPRKNLFMPDLAAVIDRQKEVSDSSLLSSKSL